MLIDSLLTAMSSSAIGLAIYSALSLCSNMFQWGIHQTAEIENQMTSVERVIEYSLLEPEAALESNQGTVGVVRAARIYLAVIFFLQIF
jgi:hypothetical protein